MDVSTSIGTSGADGGAPTERDIVILVTFSPSADPPSIPPGSGCCTSQQDPCSTELGRPLRSRRYHGLEELDYPFHDKTITVTQCGRICSAV
jgi:hypothetical protein